MIICSIGDPYLDFDRLSQYSLIDKLDYELDQVLRYGKIFNNE